MSLTRITLSVATLFLVLAVTKTGLGVELGWHPSRLLPKQTGCEICCPECRHICQLDAKEVEVEIKCFDVESKVICIPRVVFPWDKRKQAVDCGCDCKPMEGAVCSHLSCYVGNHNGAKTRVVRILKSQTYKCPECEYTWNATERNCGPSCDGCDSCDGGCDLNSFTKATPEPGPTIELGESTTPAQTPAETWSSLPTAAQASGEVPSYATGPSIDRYIDVDAKSWEALVDGPEFGTQSRVKIAKPAMHRLPSVTR